MQHITYPLNNGFIDSWLLAGPHVHVVEQLEQYQGPEYKQQLVRAAYTQETDLHGQLPCEQAKLHIGDTSLHWQVYRCQADHFVDLTAFYHLTSYLRSWAYAEIMLPQAGHVRLELTTNAPADLWLNNQHIGRAEHFHHQIPHTVSFEAQLNAGLNRLLVRFEAIAARECPYVMALRLIPEQHNPANTTEQILIRLPVEHAYQELRTILEQIYDWAIVDQDVFTAGETLTVRWPDNLPEGARQEIAVRLVDARGRIYIEALHRVMPGSHQSFGDVMQYPEGSYTVLLMPHPTAYYERGLRITHAIPITILKNAYTSLPDATEEQRRYQALFDAAQRESFYGQIARMQLGDWQSIKWSVVEETIVGIEERRDCSDFYLVGLLGALIRYGEHADFPAAMIERIRSCALGFRYWAHDPGADAMWFWSENHQILFHACEILAGQYFGQQILSNTGQPASWHLARGEAFALAWLHKRAAGGFREWDSNCYFEHDVLALTHIADLSNNTELAELAAVILDKLFFSMALNSFQGVFGSTHGRSYTPHIKGARQELTSGLGRMLWGMGVFNEHVLGTVALACAPSYTLPSVIAEIATAQPEELWSKEHHRQELSWDYDRTDDILDINKVTYRTPEYMLCSAQDHLAGQPGVQQHLWQATLNQDAVVFVTHPPCFSEESSHRPNFWHGHVTLPRVAQWHNTVIDIRNIPPDDWLGFTHAYFPTYAFDEYMLRDGWAFARVGNAYLAITASAGISLITRGNNAYRELRSIGHQNAWICRMGRTARDGDFRAFQRDILGLSIHFENMQLQLEALDGSSMSFGWQGPFLVDGIEQPLSGFKHYDSPICRCELGATSMDIAGWEQVLRLDFKP